MTTATEEDKPKLKRWEPANDPAYKALREIQETLAAEASTDMQKAAGILDAMLRTIDMAAERGIRVRADSDRTREIAASLADDYRDMTGGGGVGVYKTVLLSLAGRPDVTPELLRHIFDDGSQNPEAILSEMMRSGPPNSTSRIAMSLRRAASQAKAVARWALGGPRPETHEEANRIADGVFGGPYKKPLEERR